MSTKVKIAILLVLILATLGTIAAFPDSGKILINLWQTATTIISTIFTWGTVLILFGGCLIVGYFARKALGKIVLIFEANQVELFWRWIYGFLIAIIIGIVWYELYMFLTANVRAINEAIGFIDKSLARPFETGPTWVAILATIEFLIVYIAEDITD